MVPAAVQQVICNEIKLLQKSSWHKRNSRNFSIITDIVGTPCGVYIIYSSVSNEHGRVPQKNIFTNNRKSLQEHARQILLDFVPRLYTKQYVICKYQTNLKLVGTVRNNINNICSRDTSRLC